MNNTPKVSVILTSFNHAKYLRESIESVTSQTYTNFEFIIWDDGSMDESKSIISSYSDHRIKAFYNDKSLGPVFGINKAITELASGEYIAIHHSDDIWETEKLQKQVFFLNSHPNIGAVFTNALAIGEDSNSLDSQETHYYSSIFEQENRSKYEWLNHFFYKGNALCHPSILIRKRCYEECGVYKNFLAQLPDFDMWIRLCLKYEIYVLSEKLVRFRVRLNEANTSGNRPDSRIRTISESRFVLNNYLELANCKELLEVFPEESNFLSKEGGEPKFILAMAALKKESSYLKSFGINLLFDLIGNEDSANNLKSLYNFTYQDLIKITGSVDVFSSEDIKKTQQENSELIHKLSNIENSRIWRSTQHIRAVYQKLASLISSKTLNNS